MLANASGLTWIDSRRLLFSEIKAGIHMALVTATENRDESRDLLVPSHERGMVHRSALSPDGRWVLAAEMENQLWLPCRLLPFDGSDTGKPIGPPGAPCIDAAWSRDGAWMYVNVNTDGRFHIWRQRFPGGAPAQVTFGPTEETGITIAPDGRSLVTSVGVTASSVWIHDRRGERQISSEGSGHLPGAGRLEARPRGSYFSLDDNKLYYLTTTSGGSTFLDGRLWVADLASGRSEPVLPDFTVSGFDISHDGTRLVFAASGDGGRPHLWIMPLDRSAPPRQISAADHDHPMFLPNGEIIFRASEGGTNYVYRMREDGTGRRKVVETPILALHGVSPDGGWVAAFAPISGDPDVTVSVFAYPVGGGPAVRICDWCKTSWSRDGRRLYLSGHENRTHVVALRAPDGLPDLPPRGLRPEDLAKLPVLQVIDEPLVAPGHDAGVFAFSKLAIQRNLYRVPLP
jgi:Tol biopolymer transport system component